VDSAGRAARARRGNFAESADTPSRRSPAEWSLEYGLLLPFKMLMLFSGGLSSFETQSTKVAILDPQKQFTILYT
jgi:hypothetical protein